MNSFNPPVPVILGIITVLEIVFIKDMHGSMFLWTCFGLYRFAQMINK